MLDGGSQDNRDAPALAGVGLTAQVAEAALRDLEPRAIGLDGDESKTLEEIGRAMGLTRERVRQIETTALVRLRVTIERKT